MISATLCAIIFPAPVVQVLPLERRSDRTSVFETGLTRARHEPAIGATKSTRLVGLRRSLASSWFISVGTSSGRQNSYWPPGSIRLSEEILLLTSAVPSVPR